MPKEIIWSRYGSEVEGEPEPVAQVGWSREASHVELGVVKTGVDPTDADDPKNGLYIQLDRDGINRLIRTLRTARDQAYGRDE